jgi:ribosomal protein L29
VVKEIIMKALDLRKKKKEDLDKELIELRKSSVLY